MQNNTALVEAAEPKTSTLQLPAETASLIKASLAENTQKAYQRALQSLTTWLSGQTLSDTLLANYITALHETGKSPATIGQLVAAVKWQLKHQSQEILNFPITQATLAGIRRAGKDRGRGQVDGLIWQDVERVCIYAETEGTLAGLRDAAMIRLMSDCLLRISEVVAVNVSDLKDKTLTVHASKTDQEGTGETLYVCDATRRVLEQYRERADITRGALFRHIRRGDHIQPQCLTPHSARRIIQKRAADAGVEGFISGHSLRVGSAVSLAQAGATVVDMQVAGRWKSSQMPAHYAKAELAERGAIARFKDGKR
jgi:site-specific recombinase XerD